ncbi:phosrestin-1 [Eurytemora carolleeae]|uniref:phosrestin-1 n=1 Tax=Eurytemora carolleeae TaxID=1294199 RepID=UPI000C7768BD|nr:phosrestin-1 [Eurytemora carolleeae]|eukprot:XP_023327176.1 phosrestin-1-like [Eurytemora affinis]
MGGTAKIFKKCAPNGRVYVYLGKREFVQCDGATEPVSGIVYIQDWKDTLKGRKVYVQLVVTFRHGREEDETMGLSFKKELIIDRTEVNPAENKEGETKLQTVLKQKLGDGAVPFTLQFPELAPNSVLICSSEDEDPSKRTMGVFYDVRAHIADANDDYTGKKGSTVSMGIRKSQYAPNDIKQRSPTSTAEKGFVFGSGKIVLEANLDKEVFYHGQDIPLHVSLNNNSKKTVKSIQCTISQICELSMVNAHYSCKVARLESQDGCPLQSGGSLNRTFILKPLAQICQGARGLCLDASLSKVQDESNLASSSISETGNNNDLLGVIVSYSIKVKVLLGGMGGELETDIPFKLVHPRPDSLEMENLNKEKTSARSKQTDKRRRMFQGQDSVLNESFHTSQDN